MADRPSPYGVFGAGGSIERYVPPAESVGMPEEVVQVAGLEKATDVVPVTSLLQGSVQVVSEPVPAGYYVFPEEPKYLAFNSKPDPKRPHRVSMGRVADLELEGTGDSQGRALNKVSAGVVDLNAAPGYLTLQAMAKEGYYVPPVIDRLYGILIDDPRRPHPYAEPGATDMSLASVIGSHSVLPEDALSIVVEDHPNDPFGSLLVDPYMVGRRMHDRTVGQPDRRKLHRVIESLGALMNNQLPPHKNPEDVFKDQDVQEFMFGHNPLLWGMISGAYRQLQALAAAGKEADAQREQVYRELALGSAYARHLVRLAGNMRRYTDDDGHDTAISSMRFRSIVWDKHSQQLIHSLRQVKSLAFRKEAKKVVNRFGSVNPRTGLIFMPGPGNSLYEFDQLHGDEETARLINPGNLLEIPAGHVMAASSPDGVTAAEVAASFYDSERGLMVGGIATKLHLGLGDMHLHRSVTAVDFLLAPGRMVRQLVEAGIFIHGVAPNISALDLLTGGGPPRYAIAEFPAVGMLRLVEPIDATNPRLLYRQAGTPRVLTARAERISEADYVGEVEERKVPRKEAKTLEGKVRIVSRDPALHRPDSVQVAGVAQIGGRLAINDSSSGGRMLAAIQEDQL